MSFFSFIFLLLASCHNTNKSDRTMIEWYPTECAPRMYPIEIVTGNITTEDSTQISVPAGKIMYNGWGE
ncbi:MAG: DUF2931 family protein, partial [Chitinophagaceae bacterium]